MSVIKEEFDDLALELFDDFEVGQDAREQITLKNPGEYHPSTGTTDGPSLHGRFFPATYKAIEVGDSIFTGDVKGIFIASEWAAFDINTNTKGVDDTGQGYKVIAFEPSPKNVVIIVQLRKL